MGLIGEFFDLYVDTGSLCALHVLWPDLISDDHSNGI